MFDPIFTVYDSGPVLEGCGAVGKSMPKCRALGSQGGGGGGVNIIIKLYVYTIMGYLIENTEWL